MEWVVNATPRPLYPRERTGTHCIWGFVGPRTGLHSYTLSLTSALDGVGGQRHASAALPPGKTRNPLYMRFCGPQDRSAQVWKISSPPGFDLRTVQPVVSRYTDWATHIINFYVPLFLFLLSCLVYIFFSLFFNISYTISLLFHFPLSVSYYVFPGFSLILSFLISPTLFPRFLSIYFFFCLIWLCFFGMMEWLQILKCSVRREN
jgi:hypothetical protein